MAWLLNEFSIFIFAILLIIFLWLRYRYGYWKKNNIFYLEPHLIVGNIWPLIKSEENDVDLYRRLYDAMSDKRIAGSYFMWQPVLLIKDPHLVKDIKVKDFEYFMNHPALSDFSSSDKCVYSLFMMADSIWKDRRTKFSSSFSPKKIKDSFRCAVSNSSHMLTLIDQRLDTDVELESLVSRYVINIMMESMFGIRTDTIENEKSIFLKFGKLVTNPSLSTVIKIFIYTLFPSFYSAFKLQTFSPKIIEHFLNLIKEIEKDRENKENKPDDIIGTMLKLRENDPSFTIEEMAGHVFSFFEAGYDSTTITTSYALYEMSKDLAIQEKLREEVDRAYIEGKGHLKFDSIQNMPYMDQVIKETLRKYPPSGVIKQVCSKPYQIDDFTVPKGMTVIIPVHSFHRDPQFYPDPDKFIPEREYHQDSPYLPFGLGPRICIGMRFAELAIKVGLSTILHHYVIEPSLLHPEEITFDPNIVFITIRAKNGIWVRINKRYDLS